MFPLAAGDWPDCGLGSRSVCGGKLEWGTTPMPLAQSGGVGHFHTKPLKNIQKTLPLLPICGVLVFVVSRQQLEALASLALGLEKAR